MNIWPFSEIRKLQESLAMANLTNVQSFKNFNTLSDMIIEVRLQLTETQSALKVTQEYVREQQVKLQEANDRAFNASEAHVITMGKFEQALDRIADMIKADDGQAWKEAHKFLAQHRSTKNCVKCGSKMIELRGEDKKLCSNGACGHEVDWPLEEGQTYMYKNDVEPFIEDRSHVKEELEPAPSTRERL